MRIWYASWDLTIFCLETLRYIFVPYAWNFSLISELMLFKVEQRRTSQKRFLKWLSMNVFSGKTIEKLSHKKQAYCRDCSSEMQYHLRGDIVSTLEQWHCRVRCLPLEWPNENGKKMDHSSINPRRAIIAAHAERIPIRFRDLYVNDIRSVSIFPTPAAFIGSKVPSRAILSRIKQTPREKWPCVF